MPDHSRQQELHDEPQVDHLGSRRRLAVLAQFPSRPWPCCWRDWPCTRGTFTLDAAGKASGFVTCVNMDPCTDVGPVPDLTAAPGGGFQRSSANGSDPYYVFKTESGRYTVVSFLQQTGFGYFVATKRGTRTLPSVGDVTKLAQLQRRQPGRGHGGRRRSRSTRRAPASSTATPAPRRRSSRCPSRHAASVFVSADGSRNFFGVGVQYP